MVSLLNVGATLMLLIWASVKDAFSRGYLASAGTVFGAAPVTAHPPLWVAIGTHKVREWWHCA
ncbi:hypothetical protein ACUXPM_003744 [Ralstonia sp. 151470066-2]|jgi:hypothetical protein